MTEMVAGNRGSKRRIRKKKHAGGAGERREKPTVALSGRLVVVFTSCGEGDVGKTGDEGGGG